MRGVREESKGKSTTSKGYLKVLFKHWIAPTGRLDASQGDQTMQPPFNTALLQTRPIPSETDRIAATLIKSNRASIVRKLIKAVKSLSFAKPERTEMIATDAATH